MSKVIDTRKLESVLASLMSYLVEFKGNLVSERILSSGVKNPLLGDLLGWLSPDIEDEETQIFIAWLGSSTESEWMARDIPHIHHNFRTRSGLKQFKEDWIPPIPWTILAVQGAALPQNDRLQSRIKTVVRKRVLLPENPE